MSETSVSDRHLYEAPFDEGFAQEILSEAVKRSTAYYHEWTLDEPSVLDTDPNSKEERLKNHFDRIQEQCQALNDYIQVVETPDHFKYLSRFCYHSAVWYDSHRKPDGSIELLEVDTARRLIRSDIWELKKKSELANEEKLLYTLIDRSQLLLSLQHELFPYNPEDVEFGTEEEEDIEPLMGGLSISSEGLGAGAATPPDLVGMGDWSTAADYVPSQVSLRPMQSDTARRGEASASKSRTVQEDEESPSEDDQGIFGPQLAFDLPDEGSADEGDKGKGPAQ